MKKDKENSIIRTHSFKDFYQTNKPVFKPLFRVSLIAIVITILFFQDKFLIVLATLFIFLLPFMIIALSTQKLYFERDNLVIRDSIEVPYSHLHSYKWEGSTLTLVDKEDNLTFTLANLLDNEKSLISTRLKDLNVIESH